MKKIFNYIKNNKGQALVEYIIFILVLLMASYGAVKLFIIAWKYKFNFISTNYGGIISVLFQ